MQKNSRRKRSRARLPYRFRQRKTGTVICLTVLAAVMAGCIVVFGFPAPIQAWIDIQPDRHAVNGSLHNEESREVGEGNFWVLLNQLPTIPEGSRECNLEYENPAGNHYSARVSLYLKETGKLLGSTRRIDPGNYVEFLLLKTSFAEGEYPLTVRIELFEETRPSGSMTLEIILRVTKQEK